MPTVITTVDNNNPIAFRVFGPGWNLTNGTGYNNQYRSHSSGVAANTYAQWMLAAPNSATYNVYTTWVPLASASQNATYSIYNNSTLLSQVFVNQQNAPNADLVISGIPFQILGTFTTTTGYSIFTVRLGLASDGDVVADACSLATP